MKQLITALLGSVCVIGTLAGPVFSQPPEDLITVAERSDFKRTSLSLEVVDFMEAAARSDWIGTHPFGETVEGRPLLAAVVGNDATIQTRDSRMRVLLLGNIHSGECAGKEALLQLLRELALDAEHAWLPNAIIVIAPNYNADGNDQVGSNEHHRPGQVGPEAGMGVRENAQMLDLNRDFTKLESPEARALVQLIDDFDPHLFIDCHTTNGTRHRYQLTYDTPHNPSAPQPLRQFMRNRMMPTITRRLAEQGTDTFYYGNLRGGSWNSFGHEPRYSTEYVGLRGRLAVLAEAYSYIPYQERIEASYQFVTACVDYLLENDRAIDDLLQTTRRQFVTTAETEPDRTLIHLNATPRAFEDQVTILGFDEDGNPKDFVVPFVADYQPTASEPLPFAYLFSEELSRVADRLKMHGIQLHQLSEAIEIEVETNRIQSIRKADRPFQGHKMTSLQTEQHRASQSFPPGTYVIRTAQPLGKLAAYLLEPTSDDGFVTWNFLDPWLAAGDAFPVDQLNAPIELPLHDVSQVRPSTRLTFDLLLGENKINVGGSAADVPEWLPGENRYRQIWRGTWSNRSVEVDAKTGATFPLTSAWSRVELVAALKAFGLEPSAATDVARAANGGTLSTDQRFLLIEHQAAHYVYDLPNQSIHGISTGGPPAELATFSPDGNFIAFVSNQNLYLFDCLSGQTTPLTHHRDGQHLAGKLDWVYQEELYGRGNFKGFWWSPDSQHIAYLELDVSGIQPYLIKDNIPIENTVETTRYPKAGSSQAIPVIKVYNLSGGETQTADLGEHNDREDAIVISQISWHPDSEWVMAQVQNRQQTYLDLLAIEPASGTSRKLFRDQTPAWIESPGEPAWLADGSILWVSPRSGKNQVYQFSPDGQLLRQVTDEPYGVTSLIGVRGADQAVLYAAKLDGIRQNVFARDLGAGDVQRLTRQAGNHVAHFSHDYSFFFDVVSTAATPQRIVLRDQAGRQVRVIDPNIDDHLKYLEIADPELRTITLGGEGERFETTALLILPPDFDPHHRYPVLYHVYAGPQAPTVRDQFRGGWYLWHQMLAQHGYVILMCDNRSATHFGPDNAWPIHRNLGQLELQDITLVVQWLRQQDWVDADRIGIWGWSYGGYMTAFAMTHSDLFKAGIAGAPVTDWRNYDTIYTERYMGTPQDNPAGYDASSVVNAADDLQGKLLLIHGTIDDNVHISNSMQLVYALQQAGKDFQLMLYPRSRHGVRDDAQVRHLRQLMFRFILENL